MDDQGIGADETTATLTELVISSGVRGKTAAVQVHGYTDVSALARLCDAGAHVLTVTPPTAGSTPRTGTNYPN